VADPKLYRRGDVWWARILGKRVTTGCKDRQAALLRARVLEREHADPAHRAANEATLGDALVAFLADRAAHGRSKGTLHCYRIKVRHLGAVLGVTLPLVQVTAERVDGYTRRRLDDGASRNTIGKELTVLRGVLKLARRRGLYDRDPGAVLPTGWSTDYKPRRRSLSSTEAEEAIRALAKALPHRAAWVALALGTGARRGEIERIRREDVRLDLGTVRIAGTKTDKSDRVVPVLSVTRPFLAAALAWGAHSGRLVPAWTNVGRDLPAVLVGLGYERATPNDLRRTLANWLRAAGVEASLIGEMLGHTDSRMVERVYGRLSPAQLAAALETRLGAVPDLYRTGQSGRDTLGTVDSDQGAFPAGFAVPRDGIEPPTRGFSIPGITPRTTRKTA
jgi:integrase